MNLFRVLKTVTLESAGHSRTFTEGEDVTENVYTEIYKQYFKKIGFIRGYGLHLAKPLVILDPIEDFVQKESNRRKIREVKEIIELLDEAIIEGSENED